MLSILIVYMCILSKKKYRRIFFFLRERKQVQDNVSFLIIVIYPIYPYVLQWAHAIGHAPYVVYHLFNDLDYSESDCDNDDYPIDLFVVPTHQQEHIYDEFGLFDDDDDEDNLTFFGKMIIMIKLREKKIIRDF